MRGPQVGLKAQVREHLHRVDQVVVVLLVVALLLDEDLPQVELRLDEPGQRSEPQPPEQLVDIVVDSLLPLCLGRLEIVLRLSHLVFEPLRLKDATQLI